MYAYLRVQASAADGIAELQERTKKKPLSIFLPTFTFLNHFYLIIPVSSFFHLFFPDSALLLASARSPLRF